MKSHYRHDPETAAGCLLSVVCLLNQPRFYDGSSTAAQIYLVGTRPGGDTGSYYICQRNKHDLAEETNQHPYLT